MNSQLYIQRRRVIEMLYEARGLIDHRLPRISVRIVEFEHYTDCRVLGRCYIDKDLIHISNEMVHWSDDHLRLVVWHELGHAYFGAVHDNTCPLMHPHSMDIVPLADLQAAFKRISVLK